MGFNFNSLWLDWRAKVPNGVPNPSNDYHLVLLKELCLSKGIDKDVVDNVMLVLEKDEKIDPETIVKYKDEDGDEKETQYSYASKQPEGTPAKTAADKLKGSDDDKKEKEPTKQMKIDPGGGLGKKDDDIDDSDTETQSQDDKKVKELNQEKARNVTKEFNEGELSQDGVSDDDYNNNPNVERVDDPIDIEDIQQHLPNPLPFPKKYLKVFERLLNTKKAGLLITDLTDSAGGGTPESTAGEIMTMILTSVDDDNEAQALADKILEHTKKTGKSTLIDKTWLKSGMLVRENIRRRYDNQFGEGNWKFKNAAWDIENEVEALGMEDYQRDKGFSTDVYFNIEVDGEIIIDEVSLKKDKNANLLNLTTGRVGDIIIRGKASPKEMKEYERLAAKSNNFRKVSNLSDDEREFLKQLQEQYVVDVPDDVDVEKVKSRQAEMHRDALKENTQEIREAVQNFNNLSEEQQLEILEKVRKEMNQKKDWAEKSLSQLREIFGNIPTDGDLSLDAIKQMMGGKGGIDRIQKNSAIMMIITKELNPNSKSAGSWESIVENSHNHSRKVANYLLKNKEAKVGLLKSIREDFPIKGLLSGEENMALGDLSADQQTLRDIFGVSSFEELEEDLKVREDPPPPSIVYSVEGQEAVPISVINTRPDGIGYGTTWKLEMKLHPELAKRMDALKDVER